MKFVFSFFLLISSINIFAQSDKDKSAILEVLETQRKGWNEGDLNLYMQGYWENDSLLFVGKNGPTYGWQQTLDNYRKGYPNKKAMGFLTFGIRKVEFLSKTQAFVLGSWNLRREKDEPKGYFTLIFRKINGEWKVVVDHSS
jgi:ketosteroid isomerase-like protein